MKMTKRLLGVGLVLVLALGLFVPAGATEAPNPNAPVITRQPSVRPITFAGDPLVLEIQAELPEGVEGELSFAWFVEGREEPIATGARVTIPTLTEEVVYFLRHESVVLDLRIYVVVTNTYVDDDGEEQTASTTSNVVDTRIIHRLGAALRETWTRHGVLFTFLTLPFPLAISALLAFLVSLAHVINFLYPIFN